MTIHHARFRLSLLYLLICLFSLGCQSRYVPTEYVEGKITLEGTAVSHAQVTFIPENEGGETGYGLTDDQGIYKLSINRGKPLGGVLPGDYQVLIKKTEIEKPEGLTEEELQKVNVLALKTEWITPQKYSDKKTTPLKATVIKGKNTNLNFDLEKGNTK